MSGGLALLLADGAGAASRAAPLTPWPALPMGVLVQDRRGGVLDANPEAERLLGLTLAQMQGRHPWPFGWRLTALPGMADVGALRALPAARVQRQSLAVRDEVLHLRLLGDAVRWLQVDCAPMHNDAGMTDGSVSCISDISEQRRQGERQATPPVASPQSARMPGQAPILFA